MIGLTLVFLAMAISFYAIFQFLTGSDRVWHLMSGYPRARLPAPFHFPPNHLGGFLEMILPLGLAYTLTSRVKPLVKVAARLTPLWLFLAGIVVTLVAREPGFRPPGRCRFFFLGCCFFKPLPTRLPAPHIAGGGGGDRRLFSSSKGPFVQGPLQVTRGAKRPPAPKAVPTSGRPAHSPLA